MSRLFSKRQRLLLLMRSGGVCSSCGVRLDDGFHADHVIPWSKGGKTITSNGAALCPRCNLTKGDKTMTLNLREWQKEAAEKALHCYREIDKHFVINAAPGAGKTIAAINIANEMLKTGEIDRVIVIAPRRSIVKQWKKDFKSITGRSMTTVTGSSIRRVHADVAATWAAVAGIKDITQDMCRTSKVMVIADEVHHAAIDAAWGVGADKSMAEASKVMVLTGTPVRSDGKSSIWLHRALEVKDSRRSYNVGYDYAIEKGWCVPATFHRHEGSFRINVSGSPVYVDKNGVKSKLEGGLAKNVAEKLKFEKLVRRPMLDPKTKAPLLESYHSTMLDYANEKLNQLRSGEIGVCGIPNAGGLVIAPSIEVANYFKDLIELKFGETAAIVHSRESDSEHAIDEFRSSNDKWIVSVNMISEGVDIPRLRVMVYLPMATTELYFRQAVGRVIRKEHGEKDNSRAYIVIPEIDKFLEYAEAIEGEMGEVEADAQKIPKCPSCGAEGVKPSVGNPCPECGYEPVIIIDDFPWTCSPWSTEGCGTINPTRTRSCSCCGLPKDPPIDMEWESTEGSRNGAFARGIEITEDMVIEAELLEDSLNEQTIDDPVLAKLRSLVPLEGWPVIAAAVAKARAESAEVS